jgi:hypothetical protein
MKKTTSFPTLFPTFMFGFGQKLQLTYQYDIELNEWIGYPVFDSLDDDEKWMDDPRWDIHRKELRLITETYNAAGKWDSSVKNPDRALADLKTKLQYFHSFGWGPEGKNKWSA